MGNIPQGIKDEPLSCFFAGNVFPLPMAYFKSIPMSRTKGFPIPKGKGLPGIKKDKALIGELL